MVKDPPANAEDVRDARSIPGSGRSPCRRAWRPTPGFLPGESPGTEEPGGATVHGEGHDNRLQCSCLEDPMDRGAWRGLQSMGKDMTTRSSVLAWRIPWTEEPGGATGRGVAQSRSGLSNSHFHFMVILLSPSVGANVPDLSPPLCLVLTLTC